ncbi:hypothetical protein ACNFJN_19245 [Xenorhabdus budapestensis]|uniref:hypothetical protein n=1 Tax=Xenorhabdus budapestensis TaxID=290110 RepID=UPI003A89225B
MVTTNDVRKFIESTSYISLLNEIILSLKLNVNNENPPSQVFNIDANSINKSNIGLNELEKTCSTDINKIVKYVGVKLSCIKNDTDEYNDNDNKDILIEKMPFYKTFLIGYLIEYFILKNFPDKLDNYLKSLRMQKYKKYSLELKNIYNGL